MDRADADPGELRRSLAFIRRINRWLGYSRATVGHLEKLSRTWRAGERIEILDLATGSGDIPRAILRWADRAGRDVRITGVDLHAETVRAARDGLPGEPERADPRFRVLQADAFALPFEAGSFDYVMTAMFLHHLDDDQVVAVLREMGRLARRGVVVADLLRHYRAYAWITLFTLPAGPMVRHDGRASVAQAFTRGEILALRDRAGLQFARYHRHFGHRFVLCGEKGPQKDEGGEGAR